MSTQNYQGNQKQGETHNQEAAKETLRVNVVYFRLAPGTGKEHQMKSNEIQSFGFSSQYCTNVTSLIVTNAHILTIEKPGEGYSVPIFTIFL